MSSTFRIGKGRASTRSRLRDRRGGIAVFTAILLVVVIGCVAFAVDIGYIVMTRTQLQAAADSSSLAGGTELLAGLGMNKTKTPAEVDAAVRLRAVEYAAKNRAGDRSAVYADGERDVRLGKAVFDPVNGEWIQSWGVAPYNMVRVDLHRWSSGAEASGDGPLPLFFARILGHNTSEVNVFATTVILPSRGFNVKPGSGLTASILPFAFRKSTWYRRRDAQRWFDEQSALGANAIIDEWIEHQGEGDPDDGADLPFYDRDRPLFYDYIRDKDGNIVYEEVVDPETGQMVQKPTVQRDIFDNFSRSEIAPSEWEVTAGADGIFEVDMYPDQTVAAGNAGTIDLGTTDNSGAVLKRQILEGLNESDWQALIDQGIADGEGEFTFESDEPLDGDANTGITATILDALKTIIGEPRTMMLFENVWGGSGDNAQFRLSGFVGVSVMSVKKSGNPKHVWVQPATVVDETGLPDYDGEIGDNNSIFTPLILIE